MRYVIPSSVTGVATSAARPPVEGFVLQNQTLPLDLLMLKFKPILEVDQLLISTSKETSDLLLMHLGQLTLQVSQLNFLII